MRRTVFFAAAGVLLAVSIQSAFGLAGSHPRGLPVNNPEWPKELQGLVNRENRAGGYFVNANDFFFFQGDTAAVNEFLGAYAKLKDTPLIVVLRPGRGEGTLPGEKEKIPMDWQLSVLRRGWSLDAPMDPKAPKDKPGCVVIVDVWTGLAVRPEEIRVPPNVEVRHGAELSLTIRCTTQDIKAGDEIPIEFAVTNNGKDVYTYMDRNYDGSGRMEEYSLIAKGEDGKTIADPRASYGGGIGGGLCGEAKLQPGASFRKTIALNRWALVKTPGRYEVTGMYRMEGFSSDRGRIVTSAPIAITVKPRSAEEMAAYIEELSARLRALKENEDRAALVQKLMYTCDPRIIPALIDSMYKPQAGFWECEAFFYYLDNRAEIKSAVVEAAKKRGLGNEMLWFLRRVGVTAEEMFPLIERSLSPESPERWECGAQAAQNFRDDRFNPRLVAIALDSKTPARHIAIHALAWNRTDEGVAALRKLLEDPEERIRKETADAIRSGYENRTRGLERPLRDDDFPPEFRKAE